MFWTLKVVAGLVSVGKCLVVVFFLWNCSNKNELTFIPMGINNGLD